MDGLPPGVESRVVEHGGETFRVVTVDLQQARIALVGQSTGDPHEVQQLLDHPPDGFVVATNAGMYHTPDDPVGLFVEAGVETSPIERSTSEPGNFFLTPNAVFYVDDAGAHVVDTTAYAPAGPVALATQSGPALVLGGKLHPKFREDSKSRYIRSAVGVSDAHTVHLVLSDHQVNFWSIATLMRDELHCADALYLDGAISGMWGPAADRKPLRPHPPFSGFLVVTAPEPSGGRPPRPAPPDSKGSAGGAPPPRAPPR